VFGSLEISTSGMIAQRTRLEVASANIANQSSVLDAQGRVNPYQRRFAVLAAGSGAGGGGVGAENAALGVRVAQIGIDRTPARPRSFDPDHPLSFKSGPFKGYVAETNINSTMEQINAMEAVRAYEANVAAAEVTKQMTSVALRLLA
jgi:flagellar basal-body rod protein FlgC